MLSKFFVTALFLAYSAVQVSAHTVIAPMLGVAGTPSRDDVQQPNDKTPCGKSALSAIDTSKAAAADASGSFKVDITDFNGGTDGSRFVTVQVDAAGTGKNFVPAEVTKNGDKNPKDVGTEQLTVNLPAGTKCTGGKAGTLCLAAFKTVGGGPWGNCVVVSQGSATGGTSGSTNGTKTGAGGNNGNTGGTTAGAKRAILYYDA